MEQQPHRACERNQNKNKTKHVTFKLTTRSIVRFSPQTMQWYHWRITSLSDVRVRFLFNDILFGSTWCLVIAEIQFSLIKKNKNWTSRTLANLPTPLCPIKSHIPVNTLSQIHLKYKNYPLRAMFSNASRADVHFGFSRPLFACPIGRAILLWVWWIKFVQPCRYLFIFLDHFLILFQYFFLLI